MIRKKTTRRDFIRYSALTASSLWLAHGAGCRLFSPKPEPNYRSPNERMNLAFIGVGGRGRSNLKALANENIVALCDVDDKNAEASYKEYPHVKKYHDFRKMFDEMHQQIDAVVISTPDHMHALPAMIAMQLGKHVYCEKPLTHDLYEARMLAKTAAEYGVATQMGNQGTSTDGFRAGVEAIRGGVIGKITEAHIWTNRPVWPQGMPRPTETPPVPEHLQWDLFIGTAPYRPYHPSYQPFNWRGWWDFGTGALGDMGCHTANMAFMGLQLRSPVSAEAKNSEFSRDSFPTWSVITLDFPARLDLPPVTWTWYDGSDKKPAWVNEKLSGLIHGEKLAGSGLVLIGDKGSLYSPDDYGENWLLQPKEKFEAMASVAPTLPRCSGQHHEEWIQACKGGAPAMSNFAYAGPLTETLLLGNVAMNTGRKLDWDGANCKVTNCDDANALVRRNYRKGWAW
ncbi:MAG: Gfo/Idh/MocA family oxidoreductase [Planctomycetota bacterium]